MMQRICSALAWCLIVSGLVASWFLASRALRSIYIEVCPTFKGAWEFCHIKTRVRVHFSGSAQGVLRPPGRLLWRG